MIVEQLRALVWLRWRIRWQKFKREGSASAIIRGVMIVLLGLLALLLLIVGYIAGQRVLSPPAVLRIWDAATVVFLISWVIGLMIEFQRADAIALDKLLHLPVLPSSAMTINYLSSLVNVPLVLWGTFAGGVTGGMFQARGLTALWELPLLASFALMITAVTFQFQGWLAALMADKRRRRLIMTVLPVIFIVVMQVQQYAIRHIDFDNTSSEMQHAIEEDRSRQEREETLRQSLANGEISEEEYQRQADALLEEFARSDAANAKQQERILADEQEHSIRFRLAIPPCWLSLGSMAAVEGRVGATLLAIAGMTALGSASLWRSYRTTLNIYLGTYTARRRRPAAKKEIAPPPPVPVAQPSAAAVPGWRLPLVSDTASAVGAYTLRALLRAPEVRMALLSPLLMAAVSGPALLRVRVPSKYQLVSEYGLFVLILLSVSQLMSNQFGFDRNGFQSFVMGGARRRDILLGKNLAIAPIALGPAFLAIVILQFVVPLRVEELVGIPFLFVTTFLLFCLPANWLSIMAPTVVPLGTIRRQNPTGVGLVFQLVFGLVFSPLVVALALLPLGVQMLLQSLGWIDRLPVFLLLAALETVAAVFLYHVGLTGLGRLLQAREQKILTVVRIQDE